MNRGQKPRRSSSRQSRTRCISQPTDIRERKSFTARPISTRILLAKHHGLEHCWNGQMQVLPRATSRLKNLPPHNRIVSIYLDFAELQAKSHQLMYMKGQDSEVWRIPVAFRQKTPCVSFIPFHSQRAFSCENSWNIYCYVLLLSHLMRFKFWPNI